MTSYPRGWSYPKGQLTAADLKTMPPEEVEEARVAGRTRRMNGQPPLPPTRGQLTHDHLALMTPEQVEEARVRGQFEHLLNGSAA